MLYPFHLFYIFQLQVLLILYLKSIFLDHKHGLIVQLVYFRMNQLVHVFV